MNNQLTVYTGSKFKPVGSSTNSTSQPSNAVTGDMWFDTSNLQLYVYNGSSWTLIGPTSVTGSGVTQVVSEAIEDNVGVQKSILRFVTNDTNVAIASAETFTPGTSISGFSTITKGINLSSAIKNIGIFDIIIKLHAEVSFNITLNVATSDENAKRQKDELLNEKVIIKSPEKPEVDKKLGSDLAIEEQESESSQSDKKDKTNNKASIKKAKSKKKTEDKSEIKINTSSNNESEDKQGEESDITSTKVEDKKKK